ncbi:hypothetical protein [uncultured Desulfosarcina sp.]|uniref:hypothetical protein n=1 Tax=uncultured Desulfosarcina sp. TaxID=218289 RepID=UPI0029C7506D|nr:hypothetical protein [uncultured Desulfosarcina sp.]
MTTKLQAKNRDGKRQVYPIHLDGVTQYDIDWLYKFAVENLNVSPSVSVIIRAALSHYCSFLMAQAAGIRDLDMLGQFIQENRDLLFTVAGRPEKAYDKRYHTEKGDA